MTAILAAACIGLFCAEVAALIVRPTSRLRHRVRPYTVVARVELGRGADLAVAPPGFLGDGVVGRLFGVPLATFARRSSRLIERQGDDALALRLRQAGLDATPEEYRVRQVTGALIAGAAGFLIVTVFVGPLLGIAIGAVAFIGGAARARARVDGAITERAEAIRLQLATIDQLLALHLRAGAGPVQALQRIVDRGHGPFVDECAEALRAIRSGMSETEAFRRAANQTSEPAAARTFMLFAATAERGADLAGALLDLSNDIRDERREELRASATKRRAAMLVPTIAVLAPIMLLFIAAPLPQMVLGAR
ncbi:MAG: type II secretion system F family protein [Acidimicrobiia bacterium]